MFSPIGAIISGAIIGGLARLIMPGKQNISVLWTIVLGAVGALIGSVIANSLGVANTAVSGLVNWVLSVVAAIIAISVYLSVTGRK